METAKCALATFIAIAFMLAVAYILLPCQAQNTINEVLYWDRVQCDGELK